MPERSTRPVVRPDLPRSQHGRHRTFRHPFSPGDNCGAVRRQTFLSGGIPQ
jgi:hypothetical protein